MADAVVTSLQTCIANWATALALDSVSPQPTYLIDGEHVSQQEWRESLQKLIDAAQATINARSPYIIRSRAYLRGC